MTKPITAQDFMKQSDLFQRHTIELMGRMLDVLHDISNELQLTHKHLVELAEKADTPNDGEPARADEQLLDIADLSQWLKVAKGTIYQWRTYQNEGPPHVKVGKAVRYRRSDVERWLTEQRENQSPETREWRKAYLPGGHPGLPGKAQDDRCLGSGTEPRSASRRHGDGICAVCGHHVSVNQNGLLRVHKWRRLV